jgi:hypothetical protein
MLDVDEVMAKFCDAGAQSVRRYFDVSGIGPEIMPEYFMPAFILDRLGDKISATLETNFRTLVEWNAGVRARRGLPPQSHDETLVRLLNESRVDMALFECEDEGKPKEQRDFFALVEFKRGYIDASRIRSRTSDRDRLLMLLAHIDTCPWGVTCGWTNKDHTEWQKDSIKGTNDRWYEKRFELPETISAPLFFCARLFARSSDERRLAELLRSLPS